MTRATKCRHPNPDGTTCGACDPRFYERQRDAEIAALRKRAETAEREAEGLRHDAAEVSKLVQFFCSREGDGLGRQGDYDDLSPAATAIRAMRLLLKESRDGAWSAADRSAIGIVMTPRATKDATLCGAERKAKRR